MTLLGIGKAVDSKLKAIICRRPAYRRKAHAEILSAFLTGRSFLTKKLEIASEV